MLRTAARSLWKNPAFTAVTALVLGLGIGANTAIFSLVNAFDLRPVPGIEDPQGLVELRLLKEGRDRGGLSHPAYLYFRDHSSVFSGLAAYRFTRLDLGGAEPERILGAMVSSNYFEVLGARLALGRGFHANENETPGAHPVAVISRALWERRFGADAQAIGRTITLNGHPFTIVGIARDFRGTRRGEACDLWVPLAMHKQVDPGALASLDNWAFRWLTVIGRLKPGIALAQARSEAALLAGRLELAYPREHKGFTAAVERKYGFETDKYTALLMGMVALLLLIACANAANLLLARAAARHKEIAIRLAIGAGRGRLVRQLLVESGILAGLAGTAGLVLAWWTADLMVPLVTGPATATALTIDVSPDVRVLVFTLTVSLLSAIVFGLVPALASTRADLATALKEGSGGQALSRSRLRRVLVIGQVALSLLLLAGAGLLARSLINLRGGAPSFEAQNVLLVSVQPTAHGYDRNRASQFYRELQDRVALVPGVESASLARHLLIGNFFKEEIALEGQEGWREFGYNVVSPGYFATMRVPLVRGRDFTARDADGAPRVIMLNETMARRLFGNEDPVGRRIRIRNERSTREVVGVVKDATHPALWREPQPNMYYPLSQDHPWWATGVELYVRTKANHAAVLAAMRREIRNLDPNLPAFDVQTMAQYIDSELWALRLANAVLAATSLLALALAAAGLYGLISYAVAQRTREVGLRMALGAAPGDVLRLVVGEGLLLAAAGVAIGLAGALAATRVLGSLLYGVSAIDPATLAGVVVALLATAAAASYVPARRACRVDPLVALRHE